MKERYMKVHMDNFYKSDTSIFQAISANPELEKVPEYQDYTKVN